MTPTDQCARCRGLCSMRDCHERGGITPAAAPERNAPAPAITKRQSGVGPFAALAILGGVTAVGGPLLLLVRML